MSSTSLLTPGRTLILLSNLIVSPGAFIADWNETHVKNPKWPPHARFHNGQTMSLGTLLSLTSVYFAFKAGTASLAEAGWKQNLLYSGLIGSYYCFAGLTSILYPGTDWFDPGDTVGGAQKWLFPAQIAGVWLGCWLEVRRLGKIKTI